jgi:hypothetical protein
MGFAAIQAAYAAHNVPTYPVKDDKTPAVTAYRRIGAPYSAQLAIKFREAMAGGFCAGRRSRITIIDIDSTDAKLVDEIESKFGASPFHVASPSGGRHLHYRHGDERRRIRLLPNVDILGMGNVVCAGSETPKGRYVIARGSLDDLDHLPPLAASPTPSTRADKVPVGKRNKELFKYLHRIVAHCDDLDQLIDVGRTWADDQLAAPLADADVVKTCHSVWTYRDGRKRFMNNFFDGPTYSKLIADPDAMALAFYLSCENGPLAQFWIADGLGRKHGWPYRLVPRARKALLDLGVVECVRGPKKGAPGVYKWCLPRDE